MMIMLLSADESVIMLLSADESYQIIMGVSEKKKSKNCSLLDVLPLIGSLVVLQLIDNDNNNNNNNNNITPNTIYNK